MGAPIPTISSDNSVNFRAISWAVTEVPISAPRITGMDWRRVITAALDNPTRMTEVAVLLWNRMVRMIPARTPSSGFRVTDSRRWRSCLPRIFCNPSPMTWIP